MSDRPTVQVQAQHWASDPKIWNAVAAAASGAAVYLGGADLPPAVLHWFLIPLNLAAIVANVVLLVWFNQRSTTPPGAVQPPFNAASQAHKEDS